MCLPSTYPLRCREDRGKGSPRPRPPPLWRQKPTIVTLVTIEIDEDTKK
jgi:hypothetical protein